MSRKYSIRGGGDISKTTPTTFVDPNKSHCNTIADYANVRRQLRAYGIRKFQQDMINAGHFVGDPKIGTFISHGTKPFNPFARLVAGDTPSGDLLEQFQVAGASAFMVARNMQANIDNWASRDPLWVGKASMAKNHEFLLIRSLNWETFNVATFGMQFEADDVVPIEKRLFSLRHAIAILTDMKDVAVNYTKKAGWSRNLGLFFHVYPKNSVQALHLHMVDLDTVGPTYDVMQHKNLPLEYVLKALTNEISALTTKQVNGNGEVAVSRGRRTSSRTNVSATERSTSRGRRTSSRTKTKTNKRRRL